MKQRILWLLVPTVVTAALTAALSYYLLPTRYQSDTLILVIPQQVPESSVRSTATSPIEERLQIITQQILSRTRLERIILDFNLYPDRRKTTPMELVAEQMRSNIGVQIIKGDAFRVSFTSVEPKTAMHVTERLASLYIEENLRSREILTAGSNQFLAAQIEDMRRQIVDTEAHLHKLRARTVGELSQGDLIPYEVMKDSYRALLKKQLDARVGANLERRQIGEQFKILDPPRLPETPVGPSKVAVNVGGTLAGLGFGLVMVGVVSVRQKRPQKPGDTEAVL
jgi:uncharacterized protein involved in exopolysaccharide biosynthesis